MNTLRSHSIIVGVDESALAGQTVRWAAEQAVLELARECRRASGTLTLLWHNSTLPMARQRRWYAGLTAALAQVSSSS